MELMLYAKGICWIDDCRIPFVDENDKSKTLNSVWTIDEGSKQSDMGFGTKKIGNVSKDTGRFPANILVSDDMLNDGSIGKSNDHKWKGEDTSPIYGKYENRTRTQVYSDKGTNSRYYDIDKWFEKLLESCE